MTSIGLGIGLKTRSTKQTATGKWLCHMKLKMVGAIGFEPMTSTV